MARSATRFDIRQAGRQIGLLLGVLALLNLGFYLMYTRPAIRQYATLLQAPRTNVEFVNKRRELVEAREAYLVALQKAETDLRLLRDDVLSTRDERMVEVHEELAELAQQFQIDLDSVGYGNELMLDEELDRMVMEVPLQGNYASLRKFLQAVELSDKFLVVERVALALGKEGGVGLQLNISLATYFNAPADAVSRKHMLERDRRRARRS